MANRSREKNAEYQRIWYQKNKKRQQAKVREQKIRIRKWLLEYKKASNCSVCGENHPATLDFHHEDPSTKDINVAQMVTNGRSIKSIQAEIDKCSILCANCHRKYHYNEKNG